MFTMMLIFLKAGGFWLRSALSGSTGADLEGESRPDFRPVAFFFLFFLVANEECTLGIVSSSSSVSSSSLSKCAVWSRAE